MSDDNHAENLANEIYSCLEYEWNDLWEKIIEEKTYGGWTLEKIIDKWEEIISDWCEDNHDTIGQYSYANIMTDYGLENAIEMGLNYGGVRDADDLMWNCVITIAQEAVSNSEWANMDDEIKMMFNYAQNTYKLKKCIHKYLIKKEKNAFIERINAPPNNIDKKGGIEYRYAKERFDKKK